MPAYPRAPRSWLKEPAGRAAAQLALGHLRRAVLAAASLQARPRAPDALHDFRVSLRRLDACLRGCQDALPRDAGGGLAREIRRLARATNAARDAEVFLELMKKEAKRGSQGRPAALIRARRALGRESAQERRRIKAEVLPAFRRLAARALKRLRRRPRGLSAAGRRPMSASLKDAVSLELRDLRKHLARVKNGASGLEAHKARIRAKRARYLIEPFGSAVRKGRKTARELARLQDLLGDLHDVRGFKEFAASGTAPAERHAELCALIRTLERREKKLLKRLDRDYLRSGPRRRIPKALKLRG